MKSMFLALAIFSLSACTAKPAATTDSGPAAPVVVDPAAPAALAAGPDGGTAVVMPEAKVQISPVPAAPTTPADVKTDTMPVPPHAP